MPTLNLGRVRFNWRGAYDPAATYLEYDTVKDDGQSYVAIQDVAPTDPGPNEIGGNAFWNSMLVRGADYNAARDEAVQAASDANDSAGAASTSEGNAGDFATEAAASMEMAERWAAEAEDTEVSPGLYSAYHWAKKAEAFGDPNEFNFTADLSEDTRTGSKWMAQVLANQQASNDNGQALSQHLLAPDPHAQYEMKATLKAAAYRDVTGGDGVVFALREDGRSPVISDDVQLTKATGSYYALSAINSPGGNGHLFWSQFSSEFQKFLFISQESNNRAWIGGMS